MTKPIPLKIIIIIGPSKKIIARIINIELMKLMMINNVDVSN